MTGMLASVNSLHEAKLVLAEGVDIIDFKNPAAGSLGALDTGLVKSMLEVLQGKYQTSATIGDLPMEPERILNAVTAMADTGVNYVKIGIFSNGSITQVLQNLTAIASRAQLIAVLFADTEPDSTLIDKIKRAGFCGIMLDTLDKKGGSLTEVMPKREIQRFVSQVKANEMLCGLAGSLRLEDIKRLCCHQPDYLGFRGALCHGHERAGQVNALSVQQLKQAIAAFSS